MNAELMFMDCPAYMDRHGTARCGLPAAVECRYTLSSVDGPLEGVKIRCPRALVQRAYRGADLREIPQHCRTHRNTHRPAVGLAADKEVTAGSGRGGGGRTDSPERIRPDDALMAAASAHA